MTSILAAEVSTQGGMMLSMLGTADSSDGSRTCACGKRADNAEELQVHMVINRRRVFTINM